MKILHPKTSLEYLLFKLLHSVMVSTKVFGTFSIGSNPIEVTTFSFGVMVSTGGSNPLSVGSNPTGRTINKILYGRAYKDNVREVSRLNKVYR